MRSFLIPIAAAALVANSSMALAKIAITVDKDNQMMTVAVDGVERYNWPVSTGNPSHETPNGSFRTFRMEEDHYSKEFDDAPMPHSIFFTKVGHAIHGTLSEGNLGTPVSHGCVRISRANASTLYALVKKDGVLNTTVTLTGSSRVALARRGNKPATAVARRNVLPGDIDTAYDAAGNPMDLSPQQAAPTRRIVPQQIARDDDGYIYPADGTSNDQRYPSPRSYRSSYRAQSNSSYDSQQQYYGSQAYPAQGYYAPQPYYQPRGLFSSQY